MNHEEIKQYQRENAKPFENMLPTQVKEVYWIYAIRKNPDYPKPTERSGKWLIFSHVSKINDLWIKIKNAVEKGQLGGSAKVSTMKTNPNSKNSNQKVICVYTYDYQDKEDVLRIREALRILGITQKLPYKTDSATLEGKYSHKGNKKISVYYE